MAMVTLKYPIIREDEVRVRGSLPDLAEEVLASRLILEVDNMALHIFFRSMLTLISPCHPLTQRIRAAIR